MILLRHGQTIFNLHFTRNRRDPGVPDPPLTDEGQAQIQAAARALGGAAIARIIASPYTRALQTAAAFASTFAAPVRIDARVRERYAFSCDIGSPRSALAQAWPDHDFSAIDEVWWPDAFEPEPRVVERAAAFRTAMRADPLAARTLVVSHWGFLLALSGRSLANGEWLEWNPADPAPHQIVWQ